MRQIVNQAKDKWGALPPRNKLIIGLVIAAVLGGIISLALWSSKPDYVVLFSGLSPEDMQSIEDELNIARVPYRKSPDGASVLVPSSEVYKMRMRLANKGLPEVGAVGFEGFDKTDFGATDFVQKLKYQRALQVELARTITQLAEVSAARVHIVLPRETVFTEKEQPAKASVVLKLRPGARLSETQVNGITHLVASAVEGLQKENITVIDTSGNILSVPGESPFLSDSQLNYQRAVESELEAKVQSMLDKVLGPNKGTVHVCAEIDFNTTETSSEIYDPDKTAVKSETQTEYSSKGGAVPMGIPGMTSNITPNPQIGGGGSSEYKGSDSNVEYEVSKTIQRTIQRPGKINRLSVAVVVDNKTVNGSSVSWTQQELDDIRNLVKNAVGVDISRGDPQIEVKNIPFDTSLQQEMADAEKLMKGERLRNMIIKAGIALSIVALLIFVLRSLVKGGREISARVGQLQPRREEPPMIGQPPTEPISAVGPSAPAESALPQEAASPLQRQKKEIMEMVDRDPELIAQVLREWLSK